MEMKIDRFKLELECEVNPNYILEVGESLAEAKTKRDALETKLKGLLATKELTFRNEPPAGMKITESTVVALVDSDQEVQVLRQHLVLAKEQVYAFEAQAYALDDRKQELKNLVSLWIGGYYATSDPSEEVKRADMRKKLNQGD